MMPNIIMLNWKQCMNWTLIMYNNIWRKTFLKDSYVEFIEIKWNKLPLMLFGKRFSNMDPDSQASI